MGRRCTTESCMIAAGRKVSLDMPVASVMADPKREWSALANQGGRVRVARKLDVNWDDFNLDELMMEAINQGESELLEVKSRDSYVRIFIEE